VSDSRFKDSVQELEPLRNLEDFRVSGMMEGIFQFSEGVQCDEKFF